MLKLEELSRGGTWARVETWATSFLAPSTRRTIRFRIVSLVGLALLPLILLSLLLIYGYASAKQQLIEQQRLEITNRVSAAIDSEVSGLLGMLVGLSGGDDLTTNHVDDFRAQAARLAAQPQIVRIWAVGPTGSLIPGSDTMVGASPPEPPDALVLAKLLAGHRAVSAVRGQGLGGTRAVIAAPAMKDKKVAFAVLAEISVAELSRLFSAAGMDPSWAAAVVDRNNHFVARSLDAANRIGTPARPALGEVANGAARSGVFHNVTYEGVASMNAFHRSDLTGWTTVVAVPRAEMLAPLRRAIAAVALVGSGILAMTLLLASVLARRISEPIRDLSSFAAALGTGRASPQSQNHHVVELDDVRAALERAMSQSARLSALVASSGDAIVSIDLDGTVLSWNKGAEQLFGYSEAEIVGKSKSLIVPNSQRASYDEQRAAVMTGETTNVECWRRKRDGTLVPVSINVAPIYSPAGQIVAISSIIRDVTERKAAEEHMQFLMRELAHRSKNQLAIIQSIAGQTARRSRSVDDFVASFRQRLQALAASHDLLVSQSWRPVLISDLVKQQLTMFDDNRSHAITAAGPDVRLPAAAAEGVGLALHELATNSVKYGALSVPAGHVDITWSVTRDGAAPPRLRLEWRDSNGPPVTPPQAKGFGSQVLEKLVARSLGGTAETRYEPKGLHWVLDCDLPTS